MSIPRLHVVTDDDVLAASGFPDVACALLDAHGAGLALHLRGRETPPRRLLALAETLVPRARATGGLLLVNDRIDVALAADADGVHLAARSISPADARALIGSRPLGCSVHSADAAKAVAPWTDFLFLGTIYSTPSHPESQGAGPALVAETSAIVQCPILAIGGVTPERLADLVEAGAHGAAVIRGVWTAEDAVLAAGRYLEELDRTHRSRTERTQNEDE